jgi:DNA modification methylase
MITDTIGSISLINGDCLEVLRKLPDNSFDLAIVDPPYGSGCIEDFGGQHDCAFTVATDGTSISTKWNRFGQRFDRYKTSGNNTQPLRQICKVSITPHTTHRATAS